MSKNTKKLRKYWQLVTICYQLKGGGVHFVLPLYKKKKPKRLTWSNSIAMLFPILKIILIIPI